MEPDVKLTKLASCAGCGAKVGAGTLVKMLDGFRTHTDPRLIVGYDKSDDASVYVLSDDTAIVQTTDFFPPIVDDPFLYGQIAATNALSDVYAMGGEPKLALNIMCLADSMDDKTVREILRMGAYQLFYLDRVPDMAAVDESVSLTRAMGLEALTGLVNGVLRNMIRGKNDVVWPKPQDDAVKYLSVMFSAPAALCQMLVSAYGEHDAMEILRYRPKDRSVTVRVNYLRCDDARLRSLFADDELEFDPGILPGMYKVHSAGDMTRMRAFQNGLFTIQGESSVLAARMVGAKPGQTVLDACAAPGGKTAVLSEMMGDTGRVYAWDTHAHRVELIRGTMNRLKLENVRPAVKDASVPREDMAMTLDAALVDAPCSGTGVMNEKPDVKYRVTGEGVQALCRTQKDILDAIAPMVKVGGTLVYSTCSILPQENEAQIRTFLERHPEYEIQPMGAELPEKLAAHENALGLQMFAHRDGTDGFYVCRMRRVKV